MKSGDLLPDEDAPLLLLQLPSKSALLPMPRRIFLSLWTFLFQLTATRAAKLGDLRVTMWSDLSYGLYLIPPQHRMIIPLHPWS